MWIFATPTLQFSSRRRVGKTSALMRKARGQKINAKLFKKVPFLYQKIVAPFREH